MAPRLRRAMRLLRRGEVMFTIQLLKKRTRKYNKIVFSTKGSNFDRHFPDKGVKFKSLLTHARNNYQDP